MNKSYRQGQIQKLILLRVTRGDGPRPRNVGPDEIPPQPNATSTPDPGKSAGG